MRPGLSADEVHVWRADLRGVDEDLCGLVCAAEVERASRIVDGDRGRRWVRSRALLRELLGRYLRQDPRSLRFAASPRGKLRLHDDRVSFNLSHSGELAVYAITPTARLGIDVELACRLERFETVARRLLPAGETRRLATLEPTARQRACMQAWMRREALMKSLGCALGEATAGTAGEVCMVDIELGPGAASALASEHPLRLTCWNWTAPR
jgi:4'-phosphopantetheinyl transferase